MSDFTNKDMSPGFAESFADGLGKHRVIADLLQERLDCNPPDREVNSDRVIYIL
jgi:hypothetical protein